MPLGPTRSTVAYFSMEICLEQAIPTYSGGLGVLAGDTLRSMADLGVPVIAVTLLHRCGYFHQTLDAAGQQTEQPVEWQPERDLERVSARATVTIEGREVHVAAFQDDEGHEVTPVRVVPYDTLVICIGSQSNDFGTPGVREHALKLESVGDARRFNQRLVNSCIRAQAQAGPLLPHQLQVAIIGAGATGVELSAELHRTTREVVAYGLSRIDPDKDMRLNLIEAADRVLPALPPRLSQATLDLLTRLGVVVHTSAKVAEVLPRSVRLADGRVIAAELVVWAAGVKAPDFLADIAGLETNRINQLAVRPTLQTTRDDDIFAFGDCAACPWVVGEGRGA